MHTRIVCLANSFKEGGRCIAGVELDNNDNPKTENGHLKWIRPICNTPHGEVPNHLAQYVSILDIIEIDVTGYPEKINYQSENVRFRENSIKISGKLNPDNLYRLCDDRNFIFSNKGKAISTEGIGNLTHSLMLIKTDEFKVIEKAYPDNRKSQVRLLFSYKTIQYDLPVTDPVFIYQYQSNPGFIKQFNEALLTVSLGIEWENWYYKLVAGIILTDNPINKAVEKTDDLPF